MEIGFQRKDADSTPNKLQIGDMGVDGRIYPVSAAAMPRKKQEGELALKEHWHPSR
ncbi:MAG: hypothetical protein ABSD57_07320 [Verrucomicrobiota bacterium]